MKDASSTDVVVHAGAALTTFYQCGDVYAHDPSTLAPRGTRRGPRRSPAGSRRTPSSIPHTGELLVFSYGTTAPYLRYGVIDRAGALVHTADVRCPARGCRTTWRSPSTSSILERPAAVLGSELLAKGVYRPRFYADQPTRFGGDAAARGGADVQWFEAAPTYVLHWINAYEDGDEIVLDGYFQRDPMPRPDPADGPWAGLKKMVDVHAMGAHPYRWRFDRRTGRTHRGADPRRGVGVPEPPPAPRRVGVIATRGR
jgi:carotenoid cleavage dioxygenase-like enzyme